MLRYLLKNVDFVSQNDSRIVRQPRSMPLFERTNTRHVLGHGIVLREARNRLNLSDYLSQY